MTPVVSFDNKSFVQIYILFHEARKGEAIVITVVIRFTNLYLRQICVVKTCDHEAEKNVASGERAVKYAPYKMFGVSSFPVKFLNEPQKMLHNLSKGMTFDLL